MVSPWHLADLGMDVVAPVPTGCSQSQDAEPADVDPRCDSGTVAPSSQHNLKSLLRLCCQNPKAGRCGSRLLSACSTSRPC